MSRRTPTTTPPTSRPSSRAAKGKQAASSTPQLRQVDALPVGQTYIKNRDDPSSSGRASGAVSGRSTPLPIQAMRPGVKILPAKLPKPAVGAGGLTSDLLTPKGATKAKAAAPASSSSSAKTEEQLPKSVEVERLERMIHDVELTGESGEGLGKRALKKGKGGCFCQARIHPLNTYNPICPTCSLPLCALQLPYLPCPSCHTSLLVAPSLRSRLLVTLNRELTEQLNMERLERERLAQEEADRLWAESGGGKFPSLLSGLVKKEEPKTRRVMSLNPKTGKIQMTSFQIRPASIPSAEDEAGSSSNNPTESEEPSSRIAAPRMTFLSTSGRADRARMVLTEREAQGRWFLDVGGLELAYVPPPKPVPSTLAALAAGEASSGKKGKKRSRGKGKEKAQQAGAVTTEGVLPEEDAETKASREQKALLASWEQAAKEEEKVEEARPSPAPSSSRKTTGNVGRADSDAFVPRGAPRTTTTAARGDKPQQSVSSTPASSSAAVSTSKYSPRNPPPIRLLIPGTRVLVVQKQDQPTGKTTEGEVMEVLTRGDHPRGVKIRMKGGIVGRVVQLA